MDPVTDYWFRRIDAHLERGNELFERNERAFERFVEADDRNTAAFDRNAAAFDRNTAAFERFEAREDDLREFMREMILRVERGGREQLLEMRRIGDEITSELRAQRGALLAILDRLSPGDSGSAA
jgi:hypothetical protein